MSPYGSVCRQTTAQKHNCFSNTVAAVSALNSTDLQHFRQSFSHAIHYQDLVEMFHNDDFFCHIITK